MAAPRIGEQPVEKSNQLAGANVLTLMRMGGKWFVLKRVGERVDVRPVGQVVRQRRRRKVHGVVIPFPARAGL
ncbi:hypothetical protein NJG17_10610 [Stenotrophomonas maltophilia]|uniref:hypothetical protein n=1 Tax=Stenotrophomonas maltophilia TaxID=40324 RepID=UPI00209AD725|nr:hypothetical protein [Stenotrophomonas maltophilia]MCO7500349.1 hypothetical protein [Stenotrophomonas maltophilia]